MNYLFYTLSLHSSKKQFLFSFAAVFVVVFCADLACMYKLLARVPDGLKTMIAAVSRHLREQGRALVVEEEGSEGGRNAIAFVQSLLDLKDQYDHFLEHAFLGDPLFRQNIHSVSREFS